MATPDVLSPSLSNGFSKISLSQPVATPSDYASFSFTIPHERYVGLLACQRDPNLRELETLVTKCSKRTAASEAVVKRSNGKASGKSSKKGKDDKAVAEQDEEEIWEIELLDTVLFPEGGGQASDTGSLVLLDQQDAQPVIVRECIRRSLSAVHMCTSPIPVGARVLARVDWTRRHDLCVQHTAQHLLSAVLEHHFSCPTLGWALSTFPNLSYVELPRCPSKEELEEVERICNDLIVEGRRVRIEMELNNEEENRPATLPADYIGGVVRTVIIDNLDRNPCCGTHYPSLAPLQSIHVSQSTTPIRGTNTRVYFLAGPRCTAQLSSSLQTLRAAGTELSCANDNVDKRVKNLADQYCEATRREKRLREELAESIAFKLIHGARTSQTDDKTPLTGVLVREEEATNDFEFLSLIQAKAKDILSADSGRDYLFALGQVSDNPQVKPAGCCLIFSNKDELVAKVSDMLKKGESTLKLKGGGKGRWQGKVIEGRLSRERDEQELERLLKAAL